MPSLLEYHKHVVHSAQRPLPAALFVLLFFVSVSSAQVNGAGAAHFSAAPPTHFNAAPPTGAIAPPTSSIGRNGIAQSNIGVHHAPRLSGGSNNGNHPHHIANGTAYYPYVYGVPVPYAVDMSATDDPGDNGDDPDQEADYQGGPTVFDRRGHGPDSYIPPQYEGPAHQRDQTADADPDPEPEPPQPPTTLIFRDGHQIEVSNYAIVSQTLYDLTPGHQRKIALAELNLPATEKENDDHGVVFQLPPSSQAN